MYPVLPQADKRDEIYLESSPLIVKWIKNSEATGYGRTKKHRCGVRIPQRWVFAIMGFLAVFNAYTMRVCLSITIIEMVIPANVTTNELLNDTDICQTEYNDDTSDASAFDMARYDWSESLQGIILSSFYWGYVLTHLPGGIMAERFGGKYSLGLGILSTAVFTLLTPSAVLWGGSTALIILRICMGLGEGVTYPALNAMLAKWTPPEERSKIGSLVFAGALLGTVITSSLSGLILHYSPIGWPAVFYLFGSIGVLWFVVWTLVCFNNPDEHPFISERERIYLNERLSDHTSKEPAAIPWRHILTSGPFLSLIAAQVGHDWGFFTMVTDLPKYMSSVLKFSIKSNGFLSALPYLCMWICSLLSSCLADWLIVTGHMSTTNVRKIGTTIASIGPGIFIIAASYAGCDKTVVVTMFTIAMTLMGTFYPGMKVNGLDLSPNYSGTLMAITNGIGAFTGIITPLVVGELAPNGTRTEWRLVFWIVLCVLGVTNLVFVIYASGDTQYWNDPNYLRNERDEKRRRRANGEKSIEKFKAEQDKGYQH